MTSQQAVSDDAILETAVALHQSGNLTMSALADATGVSRATLYRRFGNKTKLLAQIATLENGSSPTDTTGRILNAARRLFTQHGFHTPTIAAIAAAADVGEATIYRLFKDRDSLLEAAVAEFAPRLHPETIATTGDLQTDLTQLIGALLTKMDDNRDLIRLGLSPSDHTLALLSRLRPSHERTRSRLAAYLQTQIDNGRLRDGDAAAWATSLLGTVLAHAVVLPIHYQQPLTDIPGTAATTVDLFLKGAARA